MTKHLHTPALDEHGRNILAFRIHVGINVVGEVQKVTKVVQRDVVCSCANP